MGVGVVNELRLFLDLCGWLGFCDARRPRDVVV